MNNKAGYRRELKFEVDDYLLEEIRYRLSPVMIKDIHQKDDSYLIRSVYFDDMRDSCLEENESGVDRRSKYRIRAYNKSTDYIVLERKSKINGMTRKDQEVISTEQFEYYKSSTPIRIDLETPCLIRDLEFERQKRGMHPKCIVEYERTAFTYQTGNVRVTFDRNIKGTDRIDSMFSDRIDGFPILGRNHSILEVKYDDYLPLFITQLLDLGSLKQQSFSKYYYVRKTISMGGQLV